MPGLSVKVYTGFDQREAVGWHVFTQSVIEKSSGSVEIVFLNTRLPEFSKSDGTNAFTKARFLVPYLNHWNGWALYVDGVDMLVRGDIMSLLDHKDDWKAVHVVKHDYETKNRRKYVGTPMEAENLPYPAKNWSSVMLFNCAHYACRVLTPEYVSKTQGSMLHDFSWVPQSKLGDLPREWNWLVDEFGPNEEAKLLHWTAGIPAFNYYSKAEHSDEWFETYERLQEGLQLQAP